LSGFEASLADEVRPVTGNAAEGRNEAIIGSWSVGVRRRRAGARGRSSAAGSSAAAGARRLRSDCGARLQLGRIYIGGNAGYGFGSSEWSDPHNFFFGNTGTFGVTGFLIGPTIGVNFQTDAFVFGIRS